MNIKATLIALALVVPFTLTGNAQAFQVYTPDQLENGIGVRGGVGFNDILPAEPDGPKFEFRTSNGSSSHGNAAGFFGGYYEGNNWYGRQDTGGRSYGDRTNTNYQSCAGKDSQVGMLNAFGSGHNGSYPCQRFR